MALIKCRECGREISDKADKCPNCGYAVRSNAQRYSQFYRPPDLHNPDETRQQSNYNHQSAYYQEPPRRSKTRKGSALSVVSLILSISGFTLSLMAIAISGSYSSQEVPAAKVDEDYIVSVVENYIKENDLNSSNRGNYTNEVKQNDTTEVEEESYNPSPNPSKQDAFSDNVIDVDISDCHVKYLKHEIVDNMSGDKCIAIYFEFTNNSNKDKAFYVTISDKAFQNGIELESSIFHVNDESKNRNAEIKPGVSVTVCSGFVLKSETSDVEIDVGEWISLDNKAKDTMILSLN